jgi:hypothetical protein
LKEFMSDAAVIQQEDIRNIRFYGNILHFFAWCVQISNKSFSQQDFSLEMHR